LYPSVIDGVWQIAQSIPVNVEPTVTDVPERVCELFEAWQVAQPDVTDECPFAPFHEPPLYVWHFSQSAVAWFAG
jgi:hypothetical protein